MRGAVFKRCGCRELSTGRKYPEGQCLQIKKKGHGAWWFRYEAPPSVDGRRRRPRIGPFKTKEEAEDALVAELAKIGADGHASDRQITVGQWLEKWIVGKLSLKPSTLASYREAINLYLKPGLGHLRLVDLRDHHASELYEAMLQINRPLSGDTKPSEMLRRLLEVRADSIRKPAKKQAPPQKSTRPLSAARLKRIHAVLSSALGTAVKKKYLTYNPVQHVELPRVARRKPLVWTAARVARWEGTGKIPAPVMVWTPVQTGAFLDYIYGTERLYALFHLVAFRGLRRAEVAGVPWTDVDLPEGTITVRETRPDDDLDPDDPKSEAGTRTITLDRVTVEVVQAWRTQQKKEKLAAGPAWIDSGLVFTKPDGAPLRPSWISQRFDTLIAQYSAVRRRHNVQGWEIERIAKRHRIPEPKVQVALDSGPLPPIRFHDLRHGSATLSLAGGVDLKVVSETLGHARSAFTADTYTSVIPQVFKAAAEATAAVVPRRVGPTTAPPTRTSGPPDASGVGRTAGGSGGSGI